MFKNNLILNRYISRKFNSAFLVVFLFFFGLIFTNQLYLVIASKLNFDLIEVFKLVFLKTIRDTHIVILFSIFISVSIVLSRLLKSSELVSIQISGANILVFFRALAPLLVFVSIIQFLLVGFISPLANKSIKQTIDFVLSKPAYLNIKAGSITNLDNGQLVYVEERDSLKGDATLFRNIFIINKLDNKVISAKEAKYIFDVETNKIFLELNNGTVFENINSSSPVILDFKKNKKLITHELNNEEFSPENDIKYKNFIELQQDMENASYLEIYYRLGYAIPLFIIVIIILNTIPKDPRSSNYSIILTLLIFLIYIGLLSFIRKNLDLSGYNVHEVFFTSFLILIFTGIITFYKDIYMKKNEQTI